MELVQELRRVMAEHDGDRDEMFKAGREFLIEKTPHPDMLAATAEFGRILQLPWGDPAKQEPWQAGR